MTKPTAEERLVKWCADHYVAPIERYNLIEIFSDAEAAARAEGRREMRERCARRAEDFSTSDGYEIAAAIRALEDEEAVYDYTRDPVNQPENMR